MVDATEYVPSLHNWNPCTEGLKVEEGKEKAQDTPRRGEGTTSEKKGGTEEGKKHEKEGKTRSPEPIRTCRKAEERLF